MSEPETAQPNMTIPILATILVVGLGTAFATGVVFDRATNRKTAAKASQAAGGAAHVIPQFASGTRPVFGSITDVSGDTITVNSQHDNSSKLIHINSQTQIVGSGKTATIADLTTGATVMVAGPETNGVVEATRIMVNPSFGPGTAGKRPVTTPDPNQY